MTWHDDVLRAEVERAAPYSAGLQPLHEEDDRRALIAAWEAGAARYEKSLRHADPEAQRKDAAMFQAIDDVARDREDAARETKERDRPKPFGARRKRPE